MNIAETIDYQADRLVTKLVGYDDEIIGAAFVMMADQYPATFSSLCREIETAKAAQQYREQSRGV